MIRFNVQDYLPEISPGTVASVAPIVLFCVAWAIFERIFERDTASGEFPDLVPGNSLAGRIVHQTKKNRMEELRMRRRMEEISSPQQSPERKRPLSDFRPAPLLPIESPSLKS